jgi:hypothetical protein
MSAGVCWFLIVLLLCIGFVRILCCVSNTIKKRTMSGLEGNGLQLLLLLGRLLVVVSTCSRRADGRDVEVSVLYVYVLFWVTCVPVTFAEGCVSLILITVQQVAAVLARRRAS